MMKKTTTASLLLAALCLGVLASCGSNGSDTNANDNPVNDNNTPDTAVETDSSIDPMYLSDIDHTKTWDGRTFRVGAQEYWGCGYEFSIEEATGEVLDDAYFNRNAKIEDIYNVKLEMDVLADPNKTVPAEVMSGSNTYDVFALCAYTGAPLAVNNYFVDLISAENINMEKGYWDQALIRDLSIDNKLFYATGDISMRANNGTFLMLFNKNLAQQNDLGDLYQLVRDGKWTMDELNSLITSVTRDLNGDGKLDPDDMWGLVTQQEAYLGFFYAANRKIIGRDKDGMPKLDLIDEGFYDVYAKIVDVLRSNNKTLSAHDYLNFYGEAALVNGRIFKEGRALFYCSNASNIKGCREMKDDFGVLPIPKYDEKQEEYVSYVYHGAALYSIPTTAADIGFSGFIMEALSEESYQSVTPVYYEITMKNKYQRDESSAEMLDVVFRNRVWDLGYIVDFGQLSTTLMNSIAKAQENFAATYEKSVKRTQKAIDNYIEAYNNSTLN